MWSPCARIAELVDRQLEYGLGVEAMMPQRPGGEDWVGVEPAWCSCGVFYILPFCAFSLRDEEGGFARRFFMENWMVTVNMFVASLHRV